MAIVIPRLLRRQKDLQGRTLHFIFEGGVKNGRSRSSFVDVANVPPFEGDQAWFELERVQQSPGCSTGLFDGWSR